MIEIKNSKSVLTVNYYIFFVKYLIRVMLFLQKKLYDRFTEKILIIRLRDLYGA